MGNCVYVFEGKRYTPEMFWQAVRSGKLPVTKQLQLGKEISIKEAEDYIKHVFGYLNPSTFRFVEQHILYSLSKPHEYLVGLTEDGITNFLKFDDGTTREWILRHEVFHTIFNYYLTDEQRRNRIADFKQLFPEHVGKDDVQIEELMADMFQDYSQKTFEFKDTRTPLKKFFDAILEFFKLKKPIRNSIEELYRAIDNGTFRNAQRLDRGYLRRTLKTDIRKYDIDEYRWAIDKLKEIYEKLHNDSREAIATHEMIKELSKHIQYFAKHHPDPEIKASYQHMLELNDKGEIHLKTLLEDAFPDLRIKHVTQITVADDNTIIDDDDVFSEDSEEVSLKDEIAQFDQIDYEKKLSDEVKSFLSYIVIPEKDGMIMSPRNAFFIVAKIFEGISFEMTGNYNEDKLIEAINRRIAELAGGHLDKMSGEPIIPNVYYKAVGKKIIDLIKDSLGIRYEIENGKVIPKGYATLHPSIKDHRKLRAGNETTFYLLKEDQINKHYNQAELELNVPKENKFTWAQLEELRGKQVTAYEFVEWVAEQTGLTKEQVTAVYKQEQARNRLAEIYNLFGSFYHKNLYVGERENNYGLFSFKYFKAQTQGAHLSFRAQIYQKFKENFVINDIPRSIFNVKFSADPNRRRTELAEFLKSLQISNIEEIIKISSNKEILTMCDSFQLIYQDVKDRLGKPIPRQKTKTTTTANNDIQNVVVTRDNVQEGDSTADYEIEKSDEINEDQDEQVYTMAHILDNYNGGINMLASKMSAVEGMQTSSSVKAADGKKMYLFTLASQAHSVLRQLMGKGLEKFPHLSLEGSLKHNRFIKNIQITDIIDHDGTKLFDEYVKSYDNETPNDWLARNLNTTFLDYLSTHDTKSSKKKYIQYFFTMDRKRLTGVETYLRTPAQIKDDIRDILTMMAERPDITGLKDYNRNSTLNFAVLDQLATTSEEAKAFLTNMRSEKITDTLVTGIYNQMQKNADQFAQHLIDQEFVPSMNLNKATKALIDNGYIDTRGLETISERIKNKGNEIFEGKAPKSQGGNYKTTFEDVVLASRVYYINHYVNSYLLNQTITGDYAFFGNGGALLKRMDKIFGPGSKGLVNNRLGMKEKFKLLIVTNPKVTVGGKEGTEFDYFNELFEGFPIFEESFDHWDGQGFMTPERAEELRKGFGRAAHMGTIFKPIHYEVVEKEVAGKKIHVPVMVKYSSVELTDELVDTFPKLKKVRDNMRRNAIGEMVFSSAIKVGTPVSDSRFDAARMLNEDIVFSAEDLQSFNFYDLSNRNYRIQLNPMHRVDTTVAYPSQLIYFLQALADSINIEEAQKIYEDMAKIMKLSSDKLFENIKSGEDVRRLLLSKEFSKENERLKEALQAGVSVNFPQLNNNAIMTLISHINRETTKIRFDGSKLILQADYGVGTKRQNKNGELVDDRFRFIKNTDGSYYAECIISSEYQNLALIGDYLSTDIFGFRIPSSELHSAIPLKVVGYHNSPNTNSIITARELVAIHGSDFDVDSLFVIRRSNYSGVRELSFGKRLLYQLLNKEMDEFFAEASKLKLTESEKALLEKYKELTNQIKSKFDESPTSAPITAQEIELEYQSYIRLPNWSPKAKKDIIRIDISNFDDDRARDEFAAFAGYKREGMSWQDTTRAEADARSIIFIRSELAKSLKNVYEKISSKKKFLSTKSEYEQKVIKSIQNKIPVGYNMVDSKLELDENFELYLDDLRSKFTDNKTREIIDSIHIKYLKNRIIEGMIRFTTNPKNRKRMMSPIMMSIFNGKDSSGKFEEGTIFRLFEDLGISFDKNYDLTDVEGNLKAFKNVFEGNSMVGKFANGMKAIAYVLRAAGKRGKEYDAAFMAIRDIDNAIEGYNHSINTARQVNDVEKIEDLESKLNTLTEERKAALTNLKEIHTKVTNTSAIIAEPLVFDGVDYSHISEAELDIEGKPTGRSIWTILDALLNSSIDNLKEQILPALNISDKTFKSWMGMIASGVNLKTVSLMSRQPVSMMLSNYDNFEKGKKELENRILEIIKSRGIEVEDKEVINIKYEDLVKGVKAQIINQANLSSYSNEELQLQIDVLLQLEKAAKIGADLSVFARAISNTLVMRSKPSDFQATIDDWNQIGHIIHDNGDLLIKSYDKKFSFDLTNLFKNVPHLAQAYRIFEKTKALLQSSIFKYNQNVEKFLNDLPVNFRFDRQSAENFNKLREEFVKFIASSILPEYSKSITIGTGANSILLNGYDAFQQDFALKIRAIQNAGIENKFIKKIAVHESRSQTINPRLYLTFHPSSNMDYSELLELEDEFEALAYIKFDLNKNGEYVAKEVDNNYEIVGGYSPLQRDFVNYALISNGLSFSASNYNSILPLKLIKEYSERIDRAFERYKDPVELSKIRDIFLVSLAANHAEKLPIINKKKYSPLTVNGKTRGRIYNGVYYDLGFELRVETNEDGRITDPDPNFKEAPEVIQHFKSQEPYIRVFTNNESISNGLRKIALYKKIGKSFNGINKYHLTEEARKGKYHIQTKFPKEILTLRVKNNKLKTYKIPVSIPDITPGMNIRLFNYSDLYNEFPVQIQVAGIDKGFMTVEPVELPKETIEVGVQTGLRELKPEKPSTFSVDPGDYTLDEIIGSIDYMTENQRNVINILKTYVHPQIGITLKESLDKGFGSYGRLENGKMGIALSKNTNNAAQTLIHEMVHASTANIINSFYLNSSVLTDKQVEAIANLIEIYDLAKGQLSLHKEYGFTDIHEFLAEAFSNPEFQAKLNSFTVKNETLWQKILRAIAELFLTEDILKYFGLNKNSRTALAFTIQNAMVLMEEEYKTHGVVSISETAYSDYISVINKMSEISDYEVDNRIKQCE